MTCPICKNKKIKKMITIKCGNTDGSYLYNSLKLKICNNCGHLFNKLTKQEIVNLDLYYTNEYAKCNLNNNRKDVDLPGTLNEASSNRYSQIYDVIKSSTCQNDVILDIGCAAGGFLKYLQSKGYKNLYGVDASKSYVKSHNIESGYKVKYGTAESLPFKDGTFDIIIMDQVLEHVINPNNAFNEARRVLKENGIFCISVPDAERYKENPDCFWLIMREHIQHFDIAHINYLCDTNGFKLLKSDHSYISIIKDSLIMPCLTVLMQKSEKTNKSGIKSNIFGKLHKDTETYLKRLNKRLKTVQNRISKIASNKNPVYIWGIGREFLYYFSNTKLKKCNIIALIDKHPFKQKFYKIDGLSVQSPDILRDHLNKSIVLITAPHYSESIKKELASLPFNGQIEVIG